MKHLILFFVSILCVPLFANAQTSQPPTNSPEPYVYKPDGIFNCNQTGSHSMSVGALSAVGGVYVPVNDAAVTLNTGYLVYKECVLRNVINEQRENGMSNLAAKSIKQIEEGRNGEALYLKDYSKELNENQLRAAEIARKNMQERNVDPAVINAVFKSYLNQNDDCTYKEGDNYYVNYLLKKVGDPRNCNPVFTVYREQQRLDAALALSLNCFERDLRDGQGFYSIRKDDPDALCPEIYTPSSVVRGSFQNIIDSPVRQAEQANDIGQIVSPLFANLALQAIGDLKGLAGLTQTQGGQASYLSRMVQETSAGLRTAAINAAIQILNAARAVENAYLSAKTSLANALSRAITDLRSAERQCWELLIPKVCSSAPSGQNTCLGPSGQTLRIATSTTASESIIAAQISPVAGPITDDIKKSEEALTLINGLIVSVTSNGSVEVQRLALQQLDSLVASRKLHNQTDVTQAQKQRDDGTTIVQQLVQDTIKQWTDGTDPNTAWCNVDNQATIDMWRTRWN